MRFSSKLIERYILTAILPYIALALLLFTALLFAQQSSRFAELLVGTRLPAALAAQFFAALVPTVLSFTIAMATLTGVLIGFSRLSGDSELIAMRAAGIGAWRVVRPVLLVGLLLSCCAFYTNLVMVPDAARALRHFGLQAALYKLNSPVEPRSFNTEIPGYLIYAREGDKAQGQWGRVFIFAQDAKKTERLVTARYGRIDASGEQSELVLNDAVSTELPARGTDGPCVTTRLAQLRLALDTGRKTLLERLRQNNPEPDELSWRDLGVFAKDKSKSESARREALTRQQKRITMSLAPFLFALFGAGVGLRLKKGGRGLGVLLSLGIMITYYLVSLIGEQMARAGTVHVLVGSWLATILTFVFGATLLLLNTSTSRRRLLLRFPRSATSLQASVRSAALKEREIAFSRPAKSLPPPRPLRWGFPSLLDAHLLRDLLINFGAAYASLATIFLVFTIFELWRFIVTTKSGAMLVARYLFFLLPLMTVQILPSSVLLATLATYALLARRSEAIAWWSCGQSVYRLVVPGLIFACGAGALLWIVQERLMPEANRRQDALRMQIRGGVTQATTPLGRQWLASSDGKRLYAYDLDEPTNHLREPVVYEFDGEGVHLQQVVEAREAAWLNSATLSLSGGRLTRLEPSRAVRGSFANSVITSVDPPSSFKPMLNKASQLSIAALSEYIRRAKARGEGSSALLIALQSRYAEPFNPVTTALIGVALALSYGRRRVVVALCYAIIGNLLFWGLSGGVRQAGSYGLLPASIAVWSPIAIFTLAGSYLLSRTRT